jgi:hypothetical protein
MAIFELTADAIVKVEETSLVSQGIKERGDLQRILRTQLATVLPGTYVLAEEFGEWEDARRSIDLLCIDSKANLVVVELKRTEDGGHMELQAIRYAAMVSKMTFADAIAAHASFLKKLGRNGDDAEAEILKFLEWDESRPTEFAQEVRIVLVSNNFKKEITTAVMWLRDYDLDIECIRLHSYKLGEKTLLDIQKIVPLPEAAAYQVQLRKKAAEVREAQAGADWSRYDLKAGQNMFYRLYKNQLFLQVVRALVKYGISVPEIQKSIAPGKFVGVDGDLSASEFRDRITTMKTPRGAAYDLRRYWLNDNDVFFSDGRTWALSNQWSLPDIPTLQDLVDRFPQAGISYSVAAEELE